MSKFLRKKTIYKNILTSQWKLSPTQTRGKYSLRLRSKQNLRVFYGGLSNRNLSQIYQGTSKNCGSAYKFMRALECRLDMVVFRMNLANTITAARQLICHGLVSVNGLSTNRPGYSLSPGDLIRAEPGVRGHEYLYLDYKFPPYLEVNCNISLGIFVRFPHHNEVLHPRSLNFKEAVDFLKLHV